MEPVYSVYLHIPFCVHRCAYCDFNTYAGIEKWIPDYTLALCREIEQAAQSAGRRVPVHTVFFGGGTPSLLPIPELEKIITSLRSAFDLTTDLEMTLEANPGTVSPAYLKGLRELGFNRLSLGMQSASPIELRLLERQHTPEDVVRAVYWARQAGFDNLNLDLIFGLPYQKLEDWERSLRLALTLHPDHFSLYALTLEHGTPMQHWVERGLLNEPDPDIAADMYELASEKLDRAGYVQYEISNWGIANSDGEPRLCRHNLQYWRNLPYFGFGAGAHGFHPGFRTANVLSPAAYIKRILEGQAQVFPRTPATADLLPVDRQAEIADTMMMGLRLTREGVNDEAFARRFNASLGDLFALQINHLEKLGLLEWSERNLRLTSKGRLLGNQVFVEFI